tara:strand:+ start:56 stop:619 length:564 start_codon:yes stop_codon:yes gene_type:complete
MTSKLKVNLINDAGDNNIITSDGSGVITSSKFKIGQVVSSQKSDTFTTTSTSFTDITGLSASITPTSTSSKILVLASIQGSQEVGGNRSYLRLMRDSTPINIADSSGSYNRLQATGGFASAHADIMDSSLSCCFLDSPSSTSSVTYKWQGIMATGTGSLYINRSDNDTDSNVMGRGASQITLMEVLP